MPYIEMPKLSDTMTEGTVVKWRKAVGDSVSVSDVISSLDFVLPRLRTISVYLILGVLNLLAVDLRLIWFFCF